VIEDLASQVKPRSPRRVLEDLVSIARALAAHDRPRPEVELYLATGATIRGRFVGNGDDRDGAIVLIQTGGTSIEPAIAFVRADQLVAVVVADASLLVRGPAPDQPAPSKLELARQAAAKTDTIAGKLGRTLPIAIVADDDDGRRAVAVLLPLLVEVIVAIAGDDMGKEALAPLAGIELAAGSTGDVGRHDKMLVVRAPKLLTEAFTRDRLRSAIEKLL
jgi:hypothetical protein